MNPFKATLIGCCVAALCVPPAWASDWEEDDSVSLTRLADPIVVPIAPAALMPSVPSADSDLYTSSTAPAIPAPSTAVDPQVALKGLPAGRYYYYFEGERRTVTMDGSSNSLDPVSMDEQPLPSEFISLLHPDDASPLLPDPTPTKLPSPKKVFEPATWLAKKGFQVIDDVGDAAKTVANATVVPAVKGTARGIKDVGSHVTPGGVVTVAAVGAVAGLGIWALCDKDMFLRKALRGNGTSAGGYAPNGYYYDPVYGYVPAGLNGYPVSTYGASTMLPANGVMPALPGLSPLPAMSGLPAYGTQLPGFGPPSLPSLGGGVPYSPYATSSPGISSFSNMGMPRTYYSPVPSISRMSGFGGGYSYHSPLSGSLPTPTYRGLSGYSSGAHLWGTGSNPNYHFVNRSTKNHPGGYYQSNPNSTQRDNWGTKGNYNLKTGAPGTHWASY